MTKPPTTATQSDVPRATAGKPAAGGPGSEVSSDAGGDRAISWRTVALRFGVVLGLVLLDLWSKSAVFAWLEGSGASELVADDCGRGHRRYHLLGEGVEWFTFMLSRNPGAAFGRFADWPWLLVAGRVLAVGFLIWLVARTPANRKWFAGALVLVLAGALGNLYDNLAFARFVEEGDGSRLEFGWVRDFIDVYFGVWEWHFPTFNVADSCITVGAVLLLLTGFVHAREEPATEPATEPAPEAEPDSASRA